jgi:peptidoglycan/LPS O-acetylase OafA/YrhL
MYEFMQSMPAEKTKRWILWPACLRCLALAMVLIHHVRSMAGVEDSFSISFGGLGIHLFLVISGYFAEVSLQSKPPTSWLVSRLRKIYPPYWIVVIAGWCAAWLSGYKPISFSAIASQMAGAILYTHHPDEYPNVATWFVSLILTCYLLSFLLAELNCGIRVSVLLFLLLGFLDNAVDVGKISGALFSYVGGSLVASSNGSWYQWILWWISAILGGIGSFHFEVSHMLTAVSLLALILVQRIEIPSALARYIKPFDQLSYGIFLVHCPIFIAISLIISPRFYLGYFLLALVASILAAAFLVWLVAFFERRLRSRYSRCRTH